jgi:uncharacterized delta-60 repeat protein
MGKMRYMVLILVLSLLVVALPDKVYSLSGPEKSFVSSIALQPDGKILVGGSFTFIGGFTRKTIYRLHADGTPDTSFNHNAIGSSTTSVSFIALQPDGKILVGCRFTTMDGVTRDKIARLHADGTVDTSFNPNTGGSVSSIALQPDGKILIGGYFYTVSGFTRKTIYRLHANGTPDTSFNPNMTGSSTTSVSSIALQPDGKILVGYEYGNQTGENNIARLHAGGALDTAFDPNKIGSASTIVLQPDGQILVGGQIHRNERGHQKQHSPASCRWYPRYKF